MKFTFKPKTIISAGLLIALLFLSSCGLDFGVPCLFCYADVVPIKKGLKTTVSGQASDYNLQKPIIGVKIYLVHLEDVGYRKAAYIDSTFTDSNGSYTFNFTTDGIAYGYELLFRPTPMGHYETYSYQYEIHNFGKNEIIDFSAARMNIAILSIHVIDNPNPPLVVRTMGFYSQKIFGANSDTTVWQFVFPNRINGIVFSINNLDTLSIINYKVDTINLTGNFQDTVYCEFTLRPKEFKLRR